MVENVKSMKNKIVRGIIEDREPRVEKVIDGYSGLLFVDKGCNSLAAMHLEHRFNHMIKRYNEIYWVQRPNRNIRYFSSATALFPPLVILSVEWGIENDRKAVNAVWKKDSLLFLQES